MGPPRVRKAEEVSPRSQREFDGVARLEVRVDCTEK